VSVMHEGRCDADGDGVPDDEDRCPDSDLELTVVVGNCNSGVEDKVLGDGCTMNELIAQCADTSTRRWGFVLCLNRLTTTWQREGLIAWKEKLRILGCGLKPGIL
jgi:hypothetical protein